MVVMANYVCMYVIFITEILICAILLSSQNLAFDMLQALICRRLEFSFFYYYYKEEENAF